MKDVKWYTHNATVGFMVAGMWNNRYYPMTSIISTASRSAAHDLLVSGDTDGYIRIFRFANDVFPVWGLIIRRFLLQVSLFEPKGGI